MSDLGFHINTGFASTMLTTKEYRKILLFIYIILKLVVIPTLLNFHLQITFPFRCNYEKLVLII